jgi:hypothetical protein
LNSPITTTAIIAEPHPLTTNPLTVRDTIHSAPAFNTHCNSIRPIRHLSPQHIRLTRICSFSFRNLPDPYVFNPQVLL